MRYWQTIIGNCLVVLFLLGCGPRIGGGEVADHLGDAPLVVDLPALYIDYDHTGTAFVGSVPVTVLGDAAGVDLSMLNLDGAQIAQLVALQIQHVQLSNRPGHPLLLVNGRAIPMPTWTAAELTTAIELLHRLNVGLEEIVPLFPVAAELGGGITLQFPIADGTLAIPLIRVDAPGDLVIATQAAYLDAIGTPPEIVIDVVYYADGTWIVDGLDATAWRGVLPLPWERLNLNTTTLQALRSAEIDTLTLTSNSEGVFVQVNGQALPHLSWADGELLNLVLLAEESELFQQALGDTPTATSLGSTLERLLPLLQMTVAELRVDFGGSDSE